MEKSNFKPKSDIQEYLFDNYNLKLYDHITNHLNDDPFFDPLSFFNLLYECFDLVNGNKNKPIDVANHLERTFFQKTISQKEYDAHLFLLSSLQELVRLHSGYRYDYQMPAYPDDNELKTCCKFISRLRIRLEQDDYPFENDMPKWTEEELAEIIKEFEWDIYIHKEVLNDINNPTEELRYLFDKKAEYLIHFGFQGPNPEFPYQCDVEISRIKDLAQIKGQKKADSLLKRIWMPEAKISFQDFLQAGIDKGIWDERHEIITKKNSLYGTGKTLLGSLYIALKGFAISENIDYKVAGKAFCEFFQVEIKESVKEPYKAFSSGNRRIVMEIKRTFQLK